MSVLAAQHWDSFANGFLCGLLLCVVINAIVPRDDGDDKKGP